MRQKLIFVLEDDKDICELISIILESEGYEVKQFHSITQFLQSIPQKVPDLYVLDISLQDGSGLDVCRGLKDSLLTVAVPVLLMSAHIELSELVGCGYDDFIRKPFDIAQFKKKIHQYD